MARFTSDDPIFDFNYFTGVPETRSSLYTNGLKLMLILDSSDILLWALALLKLANTLCYERVITSLSLLTTLKTTVW